MSRVNHQDNLPMNNEINHALPRVVYEPESRVRHPLQLIQDMYQDALAARGLAWQLLKRDISAQYRQSILGIVWAFVPPVVTAIGLTLAKDFKVLNLGETSIPYPAFVMVSMVLWQAFITSFTNMSQVARKAKGMLGKLKVPPEAFVFAGLGQITFDFIIKLIPITFFFIWFKVPITWTVLLVPVAVIHLIMLGTGMGLMIGPLATLYGDVSKFMGYFTKAWLFITPVLFPTPKRRFLALLFNLNPVTPLLVTARELATTGDLSNPVGFWISTGLAYVCFMLGWFIYRLALPFLVERA